MASQSQLHRRISGLGIVFTVLFAASFVFIGNGAAEKDSGAQVVKYYVKHKGIETAGVFAIVLSAVAFVLFIGAVRRALRNGAEHHPLATAATAGSAVYAVGLLVAAMLTLGLVDTGKYGMNGAAQTLNVLNNDMWVPVVAGLAMTALSIGIVALRSQSLPRWLAIATIVLGVLALAGPAGGIAFLLAPVWALVVAVVMLRSENEPSNQPTSVSVAAG
jgi:hypothetical protein